MAHGGIKLEENVLCLLFFQRAVYRLDTLAVVADGVLLARYDQDGELFVDTLEFAAIRILSFAQ